MAFPFTTDRIADKLLRLFHITPADELQPLAGFKILIVLKKMLDLLQRDPRQVGVGPHMLVVLRPKGVSLAACPRNQGRPNVSAGATCRLLAYSRPEGIFSFQRSW